MRPFVAFDLEISNPFPEKPGELCEFVDILGISCASIYSSETEQTVVSVNGGADGAMFEPKLSTDQVDAFLEQLRNWRALGRDIVSFNGLGFDFCVLHAEAGDDAHRQLACDLARSHVDVAFQMFCDRGFMVGLESICQAMAIGSKADGMHGDQVPALWRTSRAEQDRCLTYVRRDAEMTGLAYRAIVQAGKLCWIKKNGNGTGVWLPFFERIPEGRRLLTVKESLALPEPDTSWMTSPWPRAKFCGWLEGGPA